MLDAQDVQRLQNATPTDWSRFDQQLSDREWDKKRFEQDEKLYVRWYMKPRLNVEKSNAENRPIYEDTEYIEIMTPGEKHSIIQRPAWSQDYDRFGRQYKLFKEGQKEQQVGTPLKMAPFLTEAQVEELMYFKITTIEALANLNDAVISNFMGARDLQQQAQQYLTKLTSGDALLAQNKDLQRQIDELRMQLQAQKKQPVKA